MLLVERCKLFSSSEEQGVIDKPEYRITGTHFQEFLAPWPWVLAIEAGTQVNLHAEECLST